MHNKQILPEGERREGSEGEVSETPSVKEEKGMEIEKVPSPSPVCFACGKGEASRGDSCRIGESLLAVAACGWQQRRAGLFDKGYGEPLPEAFPFSYRSRTGRGISS